MDAMSRVLQSGCYLMGKELAAFEHAFAAYHGMRHCIGVSNGTCAIAIALRAAGVRAGDEVITTAHSAVATVAAIEQIGAVPVLADINPVSRCLDPRSVECLLSTRTRALVPVHIYGHPADMQSLLALASRHSLKIVEDCAQAAAARIEGRLVGTFGDAAAFSFYPTKNLGAMGDGGAVLTDSREIAARASALREYGWKERFISEEPGFNSRLDELQAALLAVKLPFLESWNRRRAEIASVYGCIEGGDRFSHPRCDEGMTHAWHLYVIEAEERDSLRDFLKARGVMTGIHYPLPIHMQPAYLQRLRIDGDLPDTTRLYKKILTLPLFPEMSDADTERVCKALREWRR